MPMIDKKVTKIGISFRAHKTLKSSLQLLYLTDSNSTNETEEIKVLRTRPNSILWFSQLDS